MQCVYALDTGGNRQLYASYGQIQQRPEKADGSALMNSYIKRRSRKRPNRKSGRGNALLSKRDAAARRRGRIKNEYYNNKQGIRSGGREPGKRLADITDTIITTAK